MPSRMAQLWDTLLHGYDRTVGFPLFRILAFCVIIPSALQLGYWEVPTSIGSVTPRWYDPIFIVMQIIGAFLVLTALAMGDTRPSALVERPGDLLLGCTGAIYFISIWFYYDGRPPLTVATWIQLGFSIFCFIRVRQIHVKLHQVDRQVASEKAKGRVVE